MKIPFLPERKNDEEEITIDMVPEKVRAEIERQVYAGFDFMKLYQPLEVSSSMARFVPAISIFVGILTIISVWAAR